MFRRVKSLLALPIFLGLAAASTAAGQGCQTPPFSQYHMGWMPGRTVFYATSGFSGEEISCLQQAVAKWGSAVVFASTNDWAAASLKVYKTTLPPGVGGNTDGVDGSDTYLDHATIQITNNTDLVSSCDGFLKVMIHELGHTMGLGDLNGCCGSSVMNQMLNANDSGGNIPTQVTTCDQTATGTGPTVNLQTPKSSVSGRTGSGMESGAYRTRSGTVL